MSKPTKKTKAKQTMPKQQLTNQQATALRMLVVCATDNPSTMPEVMANLTMQLLSNGVLITGSLEKALGKISEGINIASGAFNEAA